MQKLQTVNADTLFYEPLEKPPFVVDGLIPTGLTLFCGAQKIGKSWLMLKLCLCVSQGLPLWDMPTQEGDVLYLCLERPPCKGRLRQSSMWTYAFLFSSLMVAGTLCFPTAPP